MFEAKKRPADEVGKAVPVCTIEFEEIEDVQESEAIAVPNRDNGGRAALRQCRRSDAARSRRPQQKRVGMEECSAAP